MRPIANWRESEQRAERFMPKLIVVLHGAEAGARVSTTEFRHELASFGVQSVQVNVDDAAVGGAMRFGPGQPVTALVSLWLPDGSDGSDEAARQGVLRVAADAAGEPDLHAYAVTERVRLDPRPVPDGERADVVAQVALLRRPSSMTREEYLAYWLIEHTAIAIRTQNTSAYIQNIVDEALTPSSPELAAIVEEHFPMSALTSIHDFYGSRGDDAELGRRMSELMASVARFGADDGLDLVPTSRYAWRL